MFSPTRPACAALLMLSAAACDSPSGSNPPTGQAGVAIVSGAGLADTVDALLPQPLVVQVTGDNGRALANTEVAFLSTAIAEGSQQPTVVVSPTRGSGGGTYAVETTDAQGRAAVRVRMGRTAMQGGVVVAVPALEDFVVAEYTIQPGRAHRVSVEPADTAVRVGASFQPRASGVDRYGHPTSLQGVTLRVARGPVTVSGGAVSVTGVGRAAVVAEAAIGHDTAFVSVVPDGTIAAYTQVLVSDQRASLYTLRLDGSELVQRVTTTTGPGSSVSMGSSWSPDGSRIYYHDSSPDYTRGIYVLDLASGATQRLLPAEDRMLEESWPRFADGWVYFEGGSFDDRSQGTVNDPLIYRVRPDGTGKTQVTQWDRIGTARQAAPSPDGSQVAFVGSFANPKPLHVLDVASGEMRSLGVIGQSPRWLPDGSEILYLASGQLPYPMGGLRAIRPDGTGDRAVTTGETVFMGYFDLSPDGRYAVAATDRNALHVVVVATGEEIPVKINLSQTLMSPSWRP